MEGKEIFFFTSAVERARRTLRAIAAQLEPKTAAAVSELSTQLSEKEHLII